MGDSSAIINYRDCKRWVARYFLRKILRDIGMDKNYIEKIISPSHLFICGLIIIPAFLLQQAMIFKVSQAFLFTVLCFLSNRKIKIIPVLLISISIIVSNLIIPSGKIFFYIGFFPITAGGLKTGIFKAATLIGLIHISRFSIRRSFRIPGEFGKTMGKIFYYFEKITEFKIFSSRSGFIKKIDFVLLSLQDTNPKDVDARKITTSSGFCIIGSLIFFNWGLLLTNPVFWKN